MRALWLPSHLVAAALVLAVAAPARAELRISDLDVFLNDHEVTVHVVLLGVIPEALTEGIQSGIPAHVRLVIELWQYQRMIPDRILITKTIERTLAYNVVTREFKVAAVQGETRPVFTTRDLRDAQRVLSDIRLAIRLGLSGTPSFFHEGNFVSGEPDLFEAYAKEKVPAAPRPETAKPVAKPAAR